MWEVVLLQRTTDVPHGTEGPAGGPVLTRADYAHFAALPLEERERQCRIEAFRAHGPCGQGVNTTDSAVRLRHLPTGIVVVSRESRSQYQNRRNCLARLREELARRAKRRTPRKPTKPTKASVRKRLDAKTARSRVKQTRRPLRGED